ncbi:hypothetical protein DMN91_003971 [Ooceraea biroi]|uniref:Uncharacterized protein n=1 Tax=Ooceraea biroi TaxID=2015173 RepID=A0A3L8DUB6_OOCBI|nr:hypothetical protein DMN91_003971 [Ooceraea biroi]
MYPYHGTACLEFSIARRSYLARKRGNKSNMLLTVEVSKLVISMSQQDNELSREAGRADAPGPEQHQRTQQPQQQEPQRNSRSRSRSSRSRSSRSSRSSCSRSEK